jgi:hypothetical protein
MPLIPYITPEMAGDDVKQTFEVIEKFFGRVPENMMLAAYSPMLLSSLMKRPVEMALKSDLFTFHFLAGIRYHMACHDGAEYCIGFNGEILRNAGFTDEDLALVREEPLRSPFNDKQRLLMHYCTKMIKDPASFTEEDIEILHGGGLNDQEIFDAAEHAANMLKAARLLSGLKAGK